MKVLEDCKCHRTLVPRLCRGCCPSLLVLATLVRATTSYLLACMRGRRKRLIFIPVNFAVGRTVTTGS